MCSASFYSFVNRDMNVLATYLLITDKNYKIVFKFIQKVSLSHLLFFAFFTSYMLIRTKLKLQNTRTKLAFSSRLK